MFSRSVYRPGAVRLGDTGPLPMREDFGPVRTEAGHESRGERQYAQGLENLRVEFPRHLETPPGSKTGVRLVEEQRKECCGSSWRCG